MRKHSVAILKRTHAPFAPLYMVSISSKNIQAFIVPMD